jgi:hypothetical protein
MVHARIIFRPRHKCGVHRFRTMVDLLKGFLVSLDLAAQHKRDETTSSPGSKAGDMLSSLPHRKVMRLSIRIRHPVQGYSLGFQQLKPLE